MSERSIFLELDQTKMTRRDFLMSMVTVAKYAGAGYIATQINGIPTLSAQEISISNEIEAPTVARNSESFVWPSNLKGNEPFLEKDILITIDDCYDVDATQSMLSVLKEHNAKASFFPNSDYLKLDKPEIVSLWKDIYASGFDIGYHTTNHTSGLTVEQLKADFAQFTDHMRVLLDEPDFQIQFVRPPEGNWNNDWMSWVESEKLTNVKWNFVPNARNSSVEYFTAVRKHENGGGILLLHPRDFDTTWLTNHMGELTDLAESDGSSVTSLTDNS